MYIYTFWSDDSHRDRDIKYLNFEPNVDVHFCLTPLPHFGMCPLLLDLSSQSHSCGRFLWMIRPPI